MIAVPVERRGKTKAGGALLAVVEDGSAEELVATVRGVIEAGDATPHGLAQDLPEIGPQRRP